MFTSPSSAHDANYIVTESVALHLRKSIGAFEGVGKECE